MIEVEGASYQEFGRNDFSQVLQIVDDLADQNTSLSHVNNRSASSSPTGDAHLNSTTAGASGGIPLLNVSPVKPDDDGEEFMSAHGDSENEEDEVDVQNKKESTITDLDKTLSSACSNLDKTVVSLRDDLLGTCRAQATSIAEIRNQLNSQAKSVPIWDNNKVKSLFNKVTNIETDIRKVQNLCTRVEKVEYDVSAIKTDIKIVVTAVQEIKQLCTQQSKTVKMIDASTNELRVVSGI